MADAIAVSATSGTVPDGAPPAASPEIASAALSSPQNAPPQDAQPVESPALPAASPSEAPAPVAADAPKAEGDAPATVETPADEAPKAEDAAPAAPAYAEFKMPDGFTAPPEKIAAFQNIGLKYGLPQDGAQELIDFHASLMREAQQQMTQRQFDVFEAAKRDWYKSAEKEFGNRFDTVVSDAKWALNRFGGNKDQVKELKQALAASGMDTHPALARALANVTKAFKERGAPGPSLPANSSRSETPWDRRYGAGGKRS